MYATEDKKGHVKVSLTLTFKINCQDQVTGFVFFEILDLEKVRIDTEICLYYMYNQKYGKSYEYIFMTLALKVNRQGQVIYSSFFEIPDLRNVKIDTKINSAS